MRKIFLLLLLVMSFCACNAATATYEKIWLEHNVTDRYGNKCIKAHADMSIEGAKGIKVRVYAYVLDENNKYIKDNNGNNYCWYDEVTPRYNNSHWSDFDIYKAK